jgi:hypothetical protein
LEFTENSWNSLQIYPNPVLDVLQIDNPLGMDLDNVVILDVTGKVVSKYIPDENVTKFSLDMSHLATGAYIIVIKAPHGQINKRIVKE